MKDTLLITGGSGLLGSNLATVAINSFSVHVTYCNHTIVSKTVQAHKLDLTKSEGLLLLVKKIKPAYIVHTAALTNVDFCENNKEEAWLTNVEATKNVVKATKAAGSKLIYISTDSVFDGKKGMYFEEDPPNPLNYYALTKLEGEKIVGESKVPFVTIRTNIYGWNMQKKMSLAEWMLNSFIEKRKITLFSDVFFTPIFVNNLSSAILEIAKKDILGLFHVAGSERCSKLQFGLILAKVFDLDTTGLIEPVLIASQNFAAKRPLDTSLTSEKIKSKIDSNLLKVQEGLESFKQLMQNGYVENLKACQV
ncbi:MAG: SDR family oxidoreductase [Candidatus Bathyarchaeia archaeon]|jgi:dTDP-4-dehydrorhamnose reductase